MLQKYVPIHREEDDSGDYYILSDEDSNCDIEDSEFMNGDYMGVE